MFIEDRYPLYTSEEKKSVFPKVLIGCMAVFFLVAFAILGAGVYKSYFATEVYNYNINLPATKAFADNLEYTSGHGSVPNADYYAKIHKDFIDQKVSFIEADLSHMTLRVYREGAQALEVPILTKGREGSWWETPAGLYKIEGKEPNHFSSIGKVYQPWSMIFQGNFFIHGWPYHPDGTPVASTYSGGCVRLSTEDAKMVYDLSSVGMPVLVFEKDFAPDSFVYAPKEPTISAQHYLIADIKNNSVLASKGEADVVSIASITKLITALVSAEYINLDKEISIPSSALVATSKSRLYAGQSISVYQLLFPLLMESSNEAAEAIAQYLGRARFIELMNEKAKAINMQQSAFVDPAGSGAGNTSTAEDLFALAKYIYNNRSFIFKVSAGNISSSAYGVSEFSNLGDFNKIPNTTDVLIGGKIGKTTAAGETYVGVFNENIRGEDRPIAIVVLNSTDVYADMKSLLEYIHSLYTL